MSVFGIARDYAAAQERRYLTARVDRWPARGTRGLSGDPRSAGGLPGVRVARDSRREDRRGIAGSGCASACAASASTAFRPSSMSPIT